MTTHRRLRIRQTPPRPPQPPRPTPAPAARAGPIRSWYQRTDWAKHTTVLAAAVAAVSLALTAWGTYKAAQVADDQLTQSREKQDAQVRAQASRVTIWKEPGIVVLANRSLDPVRAYIGWIGFAAGQAVPVGTLPPCTAVELAHRTRASQDPSSGKGAPILGAPNLDLTFADASGKLWKRVSSGRLEPAEWYKGVNREGVAEVLGPPSPAQDPLMEQIESKTRPLEECGAAAD